MAEKESKKRKRQSNGVDTPNKKAVSEDTNTANRIKVHMSNDAGLHPVLASTPGLTAPEIPFQAYLKPLSSRHTNETQPKPHTHELLLHSSKHARLDYTASPVSLHQHLSHYVAVFDPSTQQLQVTPAYHLSMRGTLRSEAKDEENDKLRRTMGQQRDELGREFGTKKAKKAIAAKTVNAIVKGKPGEQDGVQDAIMESMAGSVAPALSEQEQLETALASKPIPKPNLAADSVEEAYTFNSLVPAADARIMPIKDWQEKARSEEEIVTHHRYPSNRVQRLGQTDDVLRLKALRYLTLLLEFHDVLQSAGRDGKKVPPKKTMQDKLSSWPEGLVDSVRRRFANTSNELPKWNLDNLYTHMCALTLFVDNWATDVTNLRHDLRMENKEISQYFRELGCKVGPPTEKEWVELNKWFGAKPMNKSVASVTRVAKVRLPLDFPKARSGRRK